MKKILFVGIRGVRGAVWEIIYGSPPGLEAF